MKQEKHNLGLYVKLFEHKFKARYNRAKVKQIQHKLNSTEDFDDYELEQYDYSEPVSHTRDMAYRW